MSAFLRTILGDQMGVKGLSLVVLIGLVGACGQTESDSEPVVQDSSDAGGAADSMTIEQVLRADQRFATLAAALDSAGLDTVLAGKDAYTLFAPPDTAFDALPKGTVPLLLGKRRDRLQTILQHHIVNKRVRADRLPEIPVLPTLTGDSIRVWTTDSTLGVGSTQIVDQDIEGTNGVIHVIDRVLHPPTVDDE